MTARIKKLACRHHESLHEGAIVWYFGGELTTRDPDSRLPQISDIMVQSVIGEIGEPLVLRNDYTIESFSCHEGELLEYFDREWIFTFTIIVTTVQTSLQNRPAMCCRKSGERGMR